MRTLAVIGVVVLAAYGLAVLALALSGRRSDARALAGFVPDCVVLFRRLATDHRVSRRRRWLVGATLLYLASPVDLVPDFIPVAGQLDDAILVAVVLRGVLADAGRDVVAEHWPGPDASLRLVLRFAGSTP